MAHIRSGGRKALVIGGSKFIGLHLVQHLAALEDQVTVFNRGQSAEDTIYPRNVSAIHGDRNNPEALIDLAANCFDVVFDICSYTPVQAAQVVDAFQGRTGHYLYCSSTACYLPTDRFPVAEEAPRGRGPLWGDYGADKAESEDILLAACHSKGFPMTLFRPQWVYGPNDYQRLASYFLDRITRGEPVLIPFDHDYCLSWCYVLDLVAAMELATHKHLALGKAYNIVGDEIMTTSGMIRACALAVGKDVEIVPSPGTKQPGFPLQPIHLIADNGAMKRDLGLVPTPIDEGLRRTAQWLKAEAKAGG